MQSSGWAVGVSCMQICMWMMSLAHLLRTAYIARVTLPLLLLLTCHCHAPAVQSEQRQPGYDISTYAAVCLLRGRAFEALENRQRAIACYTAALQ